MLRAGFAAGRRRGGRQWPGVPGVSRGADPRLSSGGGTPRWRSRRSAGRSTPSRPGDPARRSSRSRWTRNRRDSLWWSATVTPAASTGCSTARLSSTSARSRHSDRSRRCPAPSGPRFRAAGRNDRYRPGSAPHLKSHVPAVERRARIAVPPISRHMSLTPAPRASAARARRTRQAGWVSGTSATASAGTLEHLGGLVRGGDDQRQDVEPALAAVAQPSARARLVSSVLHGSPRTDPSGSS